jgi:hypothetical protein
MPDQSALALGLLQGFLNRAIAEHKPSRVWWEAMRRIRIQQAELEFQEMERCGTIRQPGAIRDDEIPF